MKSWRRAGLEEMWQSGGGGEGGGGCEPSPGVNLKPLTLVFAQSIIESSACRTFRSLLAGTSSPFNSTFPAFSCPSFWAGFIHAIPSNVLTTRWQLQYSVNDGIVRTMESGPLGFGLSLSIYPRSLGSGVLTYATRTVYLTVWSTCYETSRMK